MQTNPHLVVSISGHGFGHIAQTAPVLNQLHQYCPNLRITVRSSALETQLRSRILAPFTHMKSTGDIGMMMLSALAVDVNKSRAAYRDFHADWDMCVNDEAQLLKKLGADMVLSNVGYLPLAGAQRAGINNIALCSLNWADIYRHYCGNSGAAEDNLIINQIYTSYAQASVFFRATPGMPMQDMPNLIRVDPIADIGQNRRSALNHILKLEGHEKLILVSMGGISNYLPIENWPRISGIRYLISENCQTTHPDAIKFESIPMSFSDLLASSDALLCKPGYGSFVEATASSVPVLYVQRPDWPEAPALIAWLKSKSISCEISSLMLEQGIFTQIMKQINETPIPQPVIPTGARQVARWIAEQLKMEISD